MPLFVSITVILIVIGIICKLISKLSCGYNFSNTCLVGKTAIVTGGNQGIGYQVVLGLAARGCRVIIADKDDSSKSQKVIIKETDNPNIVCKEFDLSSIESIRNFVKDILTSEPRLDILVNNAGCGTFVNDITIDGLNKMLQVNHFGPFLLTALLVDLLKKTPNSRIIFTSSVASFQTHFKASDLCKPLSIGNEFIHSYIVYAKTKLCNIITSNYFANELKKYGITCNSLYPGIAISNLLRDTSSNTKKTFANRAIYIILVIVTWIFGKNLQEAAQTTLYLATSRKVCDVTGKYFHDCNIFLQPPITSDEKYCNEIIMESIRLVKLTKSEQLW